MSSGLGWLRLGEWMRKITFMHTAKNPLALVASFIAIGILLYSPLCNLSCAAADCSLLPRTRVAKETKQSSHCHQHEDSEQQTDQHPNSPECPNDCPTHTDAIAILSSTAKAPAAVQQSLQRIIAALPETPIFSYEGFPAQSAGGRPFRSPPKRAVISVYRI